MSRELKLKVDATLMRAVYADPLDCAISEIKAVQAAGGKLEIDPNAEGYVIEVRPMRADEHFTN